MKQMLSSKDIVAEGKTLLNCKFSVSELILDVVKDIDSKGAMLIPLKDDVAYFEKFANKADSLPRLANALFRNSCTNGNHLPIKTRYGNITHISVGKAKMAFVIVTDSGEKFVFKFGRYYNSKVVASCETFAEPKEKLYQVDDRDIDEQLECQLEHQVALYDLHRDNPMVAPYLCPVFRHYKRYNAVIEPFVSDIGRLSEVCEKTGTCTGEVIDALKSVGIGLDDLTDNPNNCGILNGKPVTIDYAL